MECFWFDREAERRREANGAEHSQFVFTDAQARIADRTYHPAAKILLAVDKIDDLLGDWIEEQAIDREVATFGIVLGGGEVDGVGMTAVAVSSIAAKGGDFDLTS